ncbi:MAG: class I SAM-dependent methyltransferase [Balneolaceae bacterium]|nr:MAG: class I SAM-dependent methyltransferase [Balneolaceae bacterium]
MKIMKKILPFNEQSYKLHADHFKDYAGTGELADHAKSWMRSDTVDAWRHQRMYRLLDPILQYDPGSSWLTVGDGRFGKDAKEIEKRGGVALATDISEHLLAEAKSIGYIKNYRIENAESLSFENDSFDYVFCKESFHHFPRPMIALYEMLRVSRKGVILIEPNDPLADKGLSSLLFNGIKNAVKSLLGRKMESHFFEPSGNYVYTLSEPEIEKAAIGLGLQWIASFRLNDSYVKGAEYEMLSENGPLQKRVNRTIRRKNVLSAAGLMPYEMIATVLFKEKPSKELIAILSDHGYKISELPVNPYINS